MTIQVSGAAAIVSQLNRAFLDTSPSNSEFNTQIAQMPGFTLNASGSVNGGVPTSEAYAFANKFAAKFASMSNAALSKEVLTNMGVLPTTDTSVAALEQALTEYFAAFGSQTKDATGAVTADTRGTIVLQLTNILSSLEDATGNVAVYKSAALAWNNEVAGSRAYSITATNTVASAKGSIANQPANLALTVENDTKTGTTGDDTFDAKTVVSSLNGTDKLDGGDGKDTLNVATSATSIGSGVSIKAIETVNIVSSGAGFTVDATKANLSGVTNLSVQNTMGGAINITAPATTTLTAITAAGAPATAAAGTAAATSAAANAAAAAATVITTPGTGAAAVAGASGNSADQAALTAAATALTAAAEAIKAGATTAAATTAANVAIAAATNATTAAATAGANGSSSDAGALNAAAAALNAARDTLVAMSIGLNGGSAPVASSVNIEGGGGVLTITAGVADGVTVGTTNANAFTSATVTGGNTVSILDKSGTAGVTGKTLTTVSLNGNAGAATLTSDGLTTLNLTKIATGTTVTNTTASHALTINTNGLKTGAGVTDGVATTVNIANTGADSKLTLTAGVATALNISGDKAVTLTAATLANTAVVTSTNTAGVTIPLAQALAQNGQSFQGSAAGNDTVSIAVAPTGTLDGGVGGTDTLLVSAPIAASAWWGTFTTTVTGTAVSAANLTTNTTVVTAASAAGATATSVNTAIQALTTAAPAGSSAALTAAIGTADTALKAAATTAAAAPGATAASVLKAVQAAEAAAVATAAGATGSTAAEAVAATAAASAAAVAAAASGATAASISTAAQTGITSLGNVYHATNFEVLSLADSAAAGSYDATGFTTLTEGLVAGAVTFDNVANSSTLTITASPTKDTTVNVVNADAGLADALTINLGSSVAASKVTTTGVENLTINTAGANSITLADAALQNLTITGNGTLTLEAANFATAPNTTAPNKGLSLVDASAATGKLKLDLSSAGVMAPTGVTVKGGAAADTITLPTTTATPTNLPIVTLGGGADTLYVGNAKVVTAGTAAGSLSLATQFNTVTDFSVGDVIGFGTGAGAGGTAVANLAGKLGAAQVSAVDDYNAFLLLATSKGAGQVSWFQTGGNTFVVQDNAAATLGVATGDIIVKLVGTIDLSNATVVTGTGGTITMV